MGSSNGGPAQALGIATGGGAIGLPGFTSTGGGNNVFSQLGSQIMNGIGDLNGSNAAAKAAADATQTAENNQNTLIRNQQNQQMMNETQASGEAAAVRGEASAKATSSLGFNSASPSNNALLASVAAPNPAKDFMGL